jgi:hypothetical protein
MTSVKLTEAAYLQHCEEYNGLCLACGEIRWGLTEPDAEGYPCEECGEDRVQGIENALLSGNLEIIAEGD